MAESLTIELPNVKSAIALAGQGEENLKILSQQTGAVIVLRGQELRIFGTEKQIDLAGRLVRSLEKLWSTGSIVSSADILTARQALDTHREGELQDLQRDILAKTRRGEEIRAKTFRQRQYIQALRKQDLIFCNGPAGTGKTFLAVVVAVQALLANEFEKLILTRPAVEAGERLGFLPGDLQQKVNPYLRPLYDAINEFIDPEKVPSLMERGVIEVAPLAYMAGILENMGFEWSEDPNQADIILYNTCTIRDNAEQKVYSYLGRQAKRKHEKPDLTLIVAGCVAQQEGEALLRRVPELDLVMGPQHANRLQDLLQQVFEGNQVVATEPIHIMEDITKPRRDSTVTAWVNVIYGCNERCTYCVVPNVRGVEQSRTPKAIRAEIEELGRQGYKEITLLGQNIDAYGRDLPGVTAEGRHQHTFTDLLYFVHDVPGIERLRFATSHPRYFTERLIRACAELPKVCEHFHIPFQSGDNEVLKRMARGYTQEKYRRIIDTIRKYIPDAAISADAIVGFPGETEQQFQNTLKLVEDIGFDQLNTAAYSPRPGTPAAQWSDQIDEEVKSDRLQRLNHLVATKAAERSQRYLGRIEEVLVEDQNPKDKTQVMGRTRTNRLTFFTGDINQLKGKLVKVKITEARAFSLTGEPIELPAPILV